jgi:hypothetical protein
MTGDVVVSKKTFAEVANRVKIIIDWTSDASGDVVSDPIDAIGFLTEIETIPGALGVIATDPPTNLYDITITDPYGWDLMDAKFIDNRLNSAPQREVMENPQWVDDYMIVTVDGAGDANKGRIIIWVDRTTP